MEREGLLALVDRQEKGYNGERRLASLGRQAGERVQWRVKAASLGRQAGERVQWRVKAC